MTSLVVSLAVILGYTEAHSWVRCSDYKAAITGGDYDESQCEGWIRGWEYDGVTFGQDRGINYQGTFVSSLMKHKLTRTMIDLCTNQLVLAADNLCAKAPWVPPPPTMDFPTRTRHPGK